MNDDLLDSRFWRWTLAQKSDDFEKTQSLRGAALALLVESVNSGEVSCLDGVNSPMAVTIQKHHRADDFEMNSHWIGSSQDWVCPCCKRTKFQISRVGGKGQILAKSVVHHDHMGEALKRAFHTAFEVAGTDVEQNEGQRLVERIGGAFAAYEEVLVCEDCNNADTTAKKLVGSPAYFSFSLSQIARFIGPKNHQSHDVDKATAQRVWSEAMPAYELRMQLIRTVAHAAATDTHWYEPHARPSQAVPVLGLASRAGDSTILKWVSYTDLVKALGPEKKEAIRNLSRWRTVVQKSGRTPPANFVAMLRSESTFAQHWDSVAEEWHCNICKRSKSQTVYVAGKGAVSFYVRSIFGRSQWAGLTICNQCSGILTNFKWEVEAQSGSKLRDFYRLVSPAEVMSIIDARAHSPHLIRQSDAEALYRLVLQRVCLASEVSEP
ncbi:MAG: hypothetical protein Q8K71_17165 [Polaromonas sp.]|nr:hypothetical protein [Polaromonas sp.]MDP3752606.1 hypothetical protein [Polaromonas sp.]